MENLPFYQIHRHVCHQLKAAYFAPSSHVIRLIQSLISRSLKFQIRTIFKEEQSPVSSIQLLILASLCHAMEEL